MRVLGIDPGLRTLGWGIVESRGSRLSHVANGLCRSGEGDLSLRLLALYRQLRDVLETHAPDAAAVEQTFVNKDGAATLKLGQARGIALLVPAQFGLAVGEYAPNTVKKTVVGVGHAAKVQVDHMVRMQLPGAVPEGPDAADALAVAICHAFHLQSAQSMARVAGGGAMIGRISGRLDYKGEDHVLIDVRGVGYIVHVSDRTRAALPAPGAAVSLFTDLLVREDLLQLFGFLSPVEKEWHRLLMSVQGVGAKASLAILGALGPEGLGRAIALGDWNSVKAAKGIGPKIAQRVVQELKDKAPAVMAMGGAPAPAPAPRDDDDAVIEAPAAPAVMTNANAQADALSALSNLGYAPSEAAAAIARVATDLPGADAAQLIRAALKLLAPA